MSDTSRVDVLLVEDDQDDLDMILRALRKANLADRVQVARDGAEALEFVFRQGAHGGRRIEDEPKVIFLDLKLPKVGGLEVLERIKGDPRTREIPVVILTSSKERADVLDGYRLGVNSYVVKPMSFGPFVAAVQELGAYWLARNQPRTSEAP